MQWTHSRISCSLPTSKKREKKGKTRLFDALDPLKHILLVAYVKKVVSPLRVEDPEGKWPIRNARVKRDS